MIASGGHSQEVKLWSLDGKKLKTFSGHQGSIVQASFSAQNQMIASASTDSTVKIWQIDGKELATLSGHNGSVRAVSFSPNHEMIASGVIKVDGP